MGNDDSKIIILTNESVTRRRARADETVCRGTSQRGRT